MLRLESCDIYFGSPSDKKYTVGQLYEATDGNRTYRYIEETLDCKRTRECTASVGYCFI